MITVTEPIPDTFHVKYNFVFLGEKTYPLTLVILQLKTEQNSVRCYVDHSVSDRHCYYVLYKANTSMSTTLRFGQSVYGHRSNQRWIFLCR